MTGEISLRSRVLPVGGIKEKVAAAAGLARVMPPARNSRDYDDNPAGVPGEALVRAVEPADDVVVAALDGK
jgi:ATP-dependent Lon protease